MLQEILSNPNSAKDENYFSSKPPELWVCYGMLTEKGYSLASNYNKELKSVEK